jgi:YfiR/HmsC-like
MHSIHRFSRCVSAGAVLLQLAAGSLAAVSPAQAADGYSEDAVKAAYLYRFAGYVDWPELGAEGEAFTIAVLGSPAVVQELRRLLPNLSVNHHPAEVREVKGLHDLGRAQILYVGAGHAGILRTLTPPQDHPMLLVTDEEGGLDAGSVLNFLTVDRRVRFEVSLTAAERARLKISSELLTVAVRVLGGRRQSRDGCVPQTAPNSVDGDCSVREVRRLPNPSISSRPGLGGKR